MAQPLLDRDILEELKVQGLYPRPGKDRLVKEFEQRVKAPFVNDFSLKLTMLQLVPQYLNRTDADKVIYPQLKDLLGKTANRHFKKFQMAGHEQDYATDRLIGCTELIQHRWWVHPLAVLSEYRRAFSECEAVLQLRRYGVAVESMLLHRSKFVYYFVIYMSIVHQINKGDNVDFTKYWYWRTGFLPTNERIEQARVYFRAIKEALRSACSTPQNIKNVEVHISKISR